MYQWKYTVLDPEYFLIVFETLRGCSFSKFPHSLIFIRRLFIRKTIFRDVDSDVRGVYEPHRTRSVDTKAEYPHKRLILNIFVRLFGVLRVVYSPLLGSFSFCEIDGQERLLGWTLLSPFAWVDQRHRKNRPQSVETVMQPPHTRFFVFFPLTADSQKDGGTARALPFRGERIHPISLRPPFLLEQTRVSYKRDRSAILVCRKRFPGEARKTALEGLKCTFIRVQTNLGGGLSRSPAAVSFVRNRSTEIAAVPTSRHKRRRNRARHSNPFFRRRR